MTWLILLVSCAFRFDLIEAGANDTKGKFTKIKIFAF